jgi:thiol-disulfide isomerase/thioredoxin
MMQLLRITGCLCSLFMSTLGLAKYTFAEPPDRSITYVDDVAPIIRDNCAGCHRPGQSGPFSFLTFDDVASHASTIQAVIRAGYMPPWKPVHTGIAFANDRRLTVAEKRIIEQWIEQGTPQGNDRNLPAQASSSTDVPAAKSVWSLGQPDLIVRMNKPYSVPADGPDIYRSFVFPIDLPEDRWVKAMELRPTARGAVHHALFFVDPDGQSRQRTHRDGQPGFSGMSFLTAAGSGFDGIAKNLNRGLGGYVPGATPNRLPGDLARRLPAGSDIVMQTHFHPVGRVVVEQAELGIYFADSAPRQQIVPLQVPSLFGIGAGIDVPAGESNYTIEESFILPIDVEAIEVGGHAHYICKSMRMTATLPDGKAIDLLRIDDWDLDWQDQYQFQDRIALPKGTTLRVRIAYDNSAANPANPFSPPRRIQWGRESNDEMGSMVLHAVAQKEVERPVLEQAIERTTRTSIRKRLQSQTTRLSRLTGYTPGPGMLLKLFDRNRDGSLQAAEIPKSHRDRLLDFFDTNLDQVLDPSEMKRARKLFEKVMQDPEESTSSIKKLGALNLSGDKTRLFEDQQGLATVVLFLKPDCPIANSYLPTVARIQKEYEPKGIRFVVMHTSPSVTAEVARQHAIDYAIELPIFLDTDLTVARALDATVTPEAIIVDASGVVRYRGRIDDKYTDFGERRPAPTRKDLCEALEDIISGQTVRVATTEVIGCIIQK